MATLVLSLYPCRCLSVCCFARKFMSKCQHCHANGTMFERCGTQRQTHTRAQGRSCNWIVYGAPCHMPHPLIGEISLLAMSSFPLQVPIDQSHLADRPHSHPFGSLWANRLSKWHDINLYLQLATCNSARNWQLEGSLAMATPHFSALIFVYNLCFLTDWHVHINHTATLAIC